MHGAIADGCFFLPAPGERCSGAKIRASAREGLFFKNQVIINEYEFGLRVLYNGRGAG
jgi:hypothetical protein